MVKVKLKDLKKELEEEQKEIYQEEAPGGSEQGLESDDDTEERYEEVIGHKPIPGQDLDEEMEEAEHARRGIPPHEKKEK